METGIRYSHQSIYRCSRSDIAQFYKLTLRRSSMMQWRLDGTADDYDHHHPVHIFMAKQDEKVIGWCLADLNPYFRQFVGGKLRCNVMVFVRAKMRRKGIGSELVHRAVQYIEKRNGFANVFPHDLISRKFYQKLNLIDEKKGTDDARIADNARGGSHDRAVSSR